MRAQLLLRTSAELQARRPPIETAHRLAAKRVCAILKASLRKCTCLATSSALLCPALPGCASFKEHGECQQTLHASR